MQAQRLFDACARRDLHLALVQLPYFWFSAAKSADSDSRNITCLRSVLMKPEHEDWIPEIWSRLIDAAAEVEVR